MTRHDLTGDRTIDQFITSGDAEALGWVLEERLRQDTTWGEQNHSAPAWLAILLEEVGEVARAVNKLTHGPGPRHPLYLTEYEAEVTQVAAVALAMLAHRARRRRREGGDEKE